MSRTRKSPRRNRGCSIDCAYCAGNRTHSSTVRAAAAAEAVSAWVADYFSPEPAPTGGVDDWGECWGTEIGRNPACRCMACDDVWSSLAGTCCYCGSMDCPY
jgi:hypothetical protein